MPIPSTHCQERLSVAYALAVIAQAGFAVMSHIGHEYGTDLLIQKVRIKNNKYFPSADGVMLQLKATTRYELKGDVISFPMDVEDYNKLVRDEDDPEEERSIILVLYCMPRDQQQWLSMTEHQLSLYHCCYWKHITEARSDNKSNTTIYIPRQQVFDTQAVEHIFEQYRKVQPGKVVQ